MPTFNTQTVEGTTGQGTTTNDQGQVVTFQPGANGAPAQNVVSGTYNATANTTGAAPTAAEQAVTAMKPGQNPNPVAPLTPSAPPPAPPVAPPPPTNNSSTTYQQGLSNAQASGTPPPTTGGTASSAVKDFLPTPPPAPPANPLTQVFSTDPNVQSAFQQIMDAQKEWLSSQSQQKSLTEQYQQMVADAGIPALNTELMDMKNVINGTEDDIRNEVTKAGGFATNSQVLALTDARNKVLIQNYNNLLETKNQAMDNINTMMQLSQQDRSYAQQQFSQQMGFDQQILQMAEQMQTNAQQSFTSTAGAIGWKGVLQQAQASGDPSAVSRVEQTMGWQPGTLQQMASAPPTLDEQYKRAEIANIYSEIADRNAKNAPQNFVTPPIVNPATGKYDPSAQLSSLINASGAKDNANLQSINAVISAVQGLAENNQDGNFPGLGLIRPGTLTIGPKGTSNQSSIEAINLQLQKWASGASLTDAQIKQVAKMAPKAGDTNKNVRNKINALTNFMLNQARGLLTSQGIPYTPTSVDFFNQPQLSTTEFNSMNTLLGL